MRTGLGSDPRFFWLVLALGAAVTGLGLAAAQVMESRGHIATGMTNQIVWASTCAPMAPRAAR